jgi:hypothetical protein
MKLNEPLRLVEDEVPIFLRHPHGEAVAGEAGIIDEDVHLAEIAEDLFANRGHGLLVGYVHGVGPGGAGRRGIEGLGDFCGIGFRAAHAGDLRAIRREAACDGFADSAACSGDDSDGCTHGCRK